MEHQFAGVVTVTDDSHDHTMDNVEALLGKAPTSHGTHVTYSATAPNMDGRLPLEQHPQYQEETINIRLIRAEHHPSIITMIGITQRQRL